MQLIFFIYLILPVLLFSGARIAGNSTWNEGFLSLDQSKALQGICILAIVFHHLSQKIYVNQALPDLIRHSLDPFVNIGFLLTSVFFFFNGYGLYKSVTQKSGYLDHFLGKRLQAPLTAYYVTGLVFFALRLLVGDNMGRKTALLYISGLVHCSPYSWYIVILILFYVVFYLVFRHTKNQKSAVVLFTGIVLIYIAVSLFIPRNSYFIRGEWWYNSVFMMPVGMLFARHESIILNHVKRYYKRYLVLHLILFYPAYQLSDYVLKKFGYFSDSIPFGVANKFISLFSQYLVVYLFISSILLLGMKISIGNRVLSFLGKYTLEIYLIHGIFVELFDHDLAGAGPSPLPVSDPLLYILAVILITLPSSIALKVIEGAVRSFIASVTNHR